jgi:hypothetical protein
MLRLEAVFRDDEIGDLKARVERRASVEDIVECRSNVSHRIGYLVVGGAVVLNALNK